PVLEDLANDPGFKGVAIVEVYPSYLFSSPEANDRIVDGWLAAYHDRAFVEPVETQLRLFLQGYFITGITETRPTMVAFNLATRRDLPPLPYVRMFRDRHHEGDYTKPGAVTQWVGDDSFKLTGDPLNQRLTDLTRWVTAIQERGGEVIWLRMITT